MILSFAFKQVAVSCTALSGLGWQSYMFFLFHTTFRLSYFIFFRHIVCIDVFPYFADAEISRFFATFASVMRETIKSLRAALVPRFGKGEAEAIIRLIFLHLKGWDTVDLIINEDKELSEFIKSQVTDILHRVLEGEPIQYVVGTAYFYGMDLKVNPSVLIPRPETEELVDLIVKGNQEPDLRVLDIGTGSGCIAIALARNLRFPDVTAIDISPEALETAKENARILKANIKFELEDIFTYSPIESSFDIIVSNPPYIDESEKSDMEANVLDHEPHSALFVPDNDPLMFYRRICDVARIALSAKGKLYFEINPRHAEEMKSLMNGSGFSDVEIIKDIHGRDRFIWGKKN